LFLFLKIFWKKIISKIKNQTLIKLELFNQKLKETKQDIPLFAFFNFMTPHYPYIPIIKALRYCKITLKESKLFGVFY